MYDADGEVVATTDDVEVGEEDEDEVVVGLDQARPRRQVLPLPMRTRMASISISMRWVCLTSVLSKPLSITNG